MCPVDASTWVLKLSATSVHDPLPLVGEFCDFNPTVHLLMFLVVSTVNFALFSML